MLYHAACYMAGIELTLATFAFFMCMHLMMHDPLQHFTSFSPAVVTSFIISFFTAGAPASSPAAAISCCICTCADAALSVLCRQFDHQSSPDRAGAASLPASAVAVPVPERAPPGLPLQRQQALLLWHVALQKVHCRSATPCFHVYKTTTRRCCFPVPSCAYCWRSLPMVYQMRKRLTLACPDHVHLLRDNVDMDHASLSASWLASMHCGSSRKQVCKPTQKLNQSLLCC